ncbi:MAG: hypothetical protein OHK0037_27670 [Elainellaceae cyanobacterium]
MSDNRPSIDERLDRVAALLETSTQQIAYLSELIISNSQAAAERDAAFNAKLDRIAEEAAQRDAALNAKLDRMAGEAAERDAALDTKLNDLTQAIATLTHQMGVMAETLTRVDLQLERLATVTENQSRISAEQAATTAALVRLVTVLTERSA